MTRNKKRLIKILISTALFIVCLCVNAFAGLPKWIVAIFFIFPYIICGYSVIIKAIKSLSYKFSLDENFLMMIASIGAFAIGEFSEACAVMILYQVGEIFQSIAVGKSRESIAEIMNLRPEFARKVTELGEEEIDLEEINVDDFLIVRSGERIPVDAILVAGEGIVDVSSLTGESLPKTVKLGETMLSGSINLGSIITIKAVKTYENSTVAKILELVESAGEKKTKSEKFITKFAKFYTPIVVGIAVTLAVVPPIIDGFWVMWLYRSLNFLVISCPCALVISVPLSYFASVGKASMLGILIKGTAYLEQITKANIYVFDKTGTLTKGNFEIVEVFPSNRKKEIMRLACCAECNSNHPIAKSILKDAQDSDYDKDYQIQEIFGSGVIAIKNSSKIVCGNEELMIQNSIKYQKCEKVGTTIYVAENGKFVGYINVLDKEKPEAKKVVSTLKMSGNRVVMLTGDNKKIAKEIAKRLGISEYYSDMLPTDKVSKLEEIMSQKKDGDVVAFVGDGINDSPALIRSDVGICMGGIGSDSSVEASDIVLIHDDLKKILTTKVLAQKTNSIAKQNIVFALFIKVLVMVLSAIGLTGLWLAIFADVGVSVIAILNAMRMLAFKE